jgi:glucose/arabinose dehydrogenase
MTRPWFQFTLLPAWLGLGAVSTAAAAVDLPDGFVHEPIRTGLAQPTSLAFLADGRLLFTEQRTGRVRMVVGNHIAVTDPVLTVPSLASGGNEEGLLAIARDPAWPQRPYVYLYYTRSGGYCRLVRYTASGMLSDPNGENLTLGTALILIDDIPNGAPNHNGACLRFGPDGKLYVSLGEDADPCGAQDSTRLKGAVLRLEVAQLGTSGGGPVTRASITPSGNPLSTSDANARLVWAYGLRNPFRFHIDPTTGKLYVADVGASSWEEISEVEAGNNLGWPFREGFVSRSQGGCSAPSGAAYRSPLAVFDHGTGAAIMSAGVYRPSSGGASNWPAEYHGDVFFADYYTGVLRRLDNSTGTWKTAPAVPGQANANDWANGLTAPVDFQIGPDGSLWYLSQFDGSFSGATGSLNRIRSGAPVAVAPSGAERKALRVSPNPFQDASELSFSLPAASPVRITVFDAAGRERRVVYTGTVAGGTTRMSWDGADETGRPVAAGVYLVRLEHPGGQETVRVLRLR